MIHAFIYSLAALVLLVPVGNWLCQQIFSLSGLKDATADETAPVHKAGRWIGALERLILAAGIILQSWEIMVAVIALKTVARFQKLDRQEFAEYFLVGSMFSILWTLLITSLWLGYDHQLGIDLRQQVAVAIGFGDVAGE